MGDQTYQNLELTHVAGGVFKATLIPERITQDFEYYVQVETKKNGTLVFPATAPEMNQTVVVIK